MASVADATVSVTEHTPVGQVLTRLAAAGTIRRLCDRWAFPIPVPRILGPRGNGNRNAWVDHVKNLRIVGERCGFEAKGSLE